MTQTPAAPNPPLFSIESHCTKRVRRLEPRQADGLCRAHKALSPAGRMSLSAQSWPHLVSPAGPTGPRLERRELFPLLLWPSSAQFPSSTTRPGQAAMLSRGVVFIFHAHTHKHTQVQANLRKGCALRKHKSTGGHNDILGRKGGPCGSKYMQWCFTT